MIFKDKLEDYTEDEFLVLVSVLLKIAQDFMASNWNSLETRLFFISRRSQNTPMVWMLSAIRHLDRKTAPTAS